MVTTAMFAPQFLAKNSLFLTTKYLHVNTDALMLWNILGTKNHKY